MHCESKVRYFYWEFDCFFFFIPESDRKYSNTNSHNFAMTLISQDDHFTAGAGAVCGSTDLRAKQSKPWLVSLALNDSYTFTWLWYPTMWKRRTFFANFCVENNWCQFLKAIIAEITSKFFTRIIIEKDGQRRIVVDLLNVHHRKRMISKSRCLTPTRLLLYFTLHPPVPEINLKVKSISGYRCSG